MKGKGLLKPFCFAGFIVVLLLLHACKSKTNNYEPTYSTDSSQKKILLYGVATQAFYELHSAFVKYLNDHLPDIHIRIVACANFLDYVEKLNSRLFDLADANAVLAIDSARIGYGILGIEVDKDANAGVILVHKDSSINGFSDLKNKTVASAGSPALAGHILPMMYLYKHGVNVNKDIKLKYFESYESIALNMYLGKCAVGFASINGWNSVIHKRPEIASKLAVKWRTPEVVGNQLLVQKNISEKTVGQLKNLILTMHLNERGRKALADLGWVRFLPADSNTFKPFKAFLKEYRALIVDPKK